VEKGYALATDLGFWGFVCACAAVAAVIGLAVGIIFWDWRMGLATALSLFGSCLINAFMIKVISKIITNNIM